MKTYTQDEVLAVIRERTEASSIRQVSREVGVSAPLLSDMLQGKRAVSDRVAELFGFRREILTEVRFRRAS